MMYTMPYYDAVVMAAWANDEQLQDAIAQQAIEQYKRTGCKLEVVQLEENERLARARRIYEEKVLTR